MLQQDKGNVCGLKGSRQAFPQYGAEVSFEGFSLCPRTLSLSWLMQHTGMRVENIYQPVCKQKTLIKSHQPYGGYYIQRMYIVISAVPAHLPQHLLYTGFPAQTGSNADSCISECCHTGL